MHCKLTPKSLENATVTLARVYHKQLPLTLTLSRTMSFYGSAMK